jgi:hypothetical protein
LKSLKPGLARAGALCHNAVGGFVRREPDIAFSLSAPSKSLVLRPQIVDPGEAPDVEIRNAGDPLAELLEFQSWGRHALADGTEADAPRRDVGDEIGDLDGGGQLAVNEERE